MIIFDMIYKSVITHPCFNMNISQWSFLILGEAYFTYITKADQTKKILIVNNPRVFERKKLVCFLTNNSIDISYPLTKVMFMS